MSDPIYFAGPADFRDWLDAHHATSTELVVGYHKKSTGRPSMTWAESVDEALCYGWIDGVRRSVDGDRYTIRFTPRKPTSIWSAGNIRRVGELAAEGRMRPPGLAAFDKRREHRSAIYSFEQEYVAFSDEYEKRFRAHASAWANFEKMAPSYRKPAIWWVISAKQESTRDKRLSILIEDSAAGVRIKLLRRPGDKTG